MEMKLDRGEKQKRNSWSKVRRGSVTRIPSRRDLLLHSAERNPSSSTETKWNDSTGSARGRLLSHTAINKRNRESLPACGLSDRQTGGRRFTRRPPADDNGDRSSSRVSARRSLTMCARRWSASACGCSCWAACGAAVAGSCGGRCGGRWRRATAAVLSAAPAAAGSPAGSSPGLRSGRSVWAWGAPPGCPGGSPPCRPAGPLLPRLHRHQQHQQRPSGWTEKAAEVYQRWSDTHADVGFFSVKSPAILSKCRNL